jgi:hypothetical protein
VIATRLARTLIKGISISLAEATGAAPAAALALAVALASKANVIAMHPAAPSFRLEI